MDRNQQRQGNLQRQQGRDRSPSRGAAQQGGHGQPARRQSQQGGGAQHFGRQTMQQGGHMPQFGSAPFQSMAEVALRGTALLWDLQMETARNLWRTQARTAAMLGVPDCSDLFEIGDARARRLFSIGAEQMLNTARQARETVSEMQRQFGRIAEKQTIGITEDVREQIAQISRHTEQGLQEIRDIAVSQADLAQAAIQPFDDGNDARRERNDESAPRDAAGSEGSRATEAEPAQWEPRFDAAHAGTNGAGEGEESGSALEAAAPHEERAPREARSRARR